MRFIKDFVYYRKNFGIKTALNLVFLPRILSKVGINHIYILKLLQWQRRCIRDVIQQYKSVALNETPLPDNYTIWTCWWQGINNMPDVIRRCHDSLLKNANGHPVVLITKTNYQQYLNLPEWVYEKVENRKISFSHFSDLIRLNLLCKYGGAWVDSALFVTRTFQHDEKFFMPRMSELNSSICQGKWCFGVMIGNKGHKIFRFMHDALLEYWRKYDASIDYLKFDGFLRIAYEEFKDVRKTIDALKVSSPDLHSSRYTFNKKVDYNHFSHLIANNEFLSLTWRINYPVEIDRTPTYYGALLNYSKT